jgi:glutathionylspermidine synthase
MLLDDFAPLLRGSRTRFIEPAWKAVLSNKGLMAVMWRMFEGHPNLLPCLFEDELDRDAAFVRRTKKVLELSGVARKPVLSREGAGVRLTAPGGKILEVSGAEGYGHHPHILQSLAVLPEFEGRRPVLGTWIVGDRCVGMGIRDDQSAITGDLSRFVPHYIAD